MFALKFDALKRKLAEDGITLKKIDTVFENTPEFEALWGLYVDNHDPLYHICTEDDGKTHTFYRAHLPTPTPAPTTGKTDS